MTPTKSLSLVKETSTLPRRRSGESIFIVSQLPFRKDVISRLGKSSETMCIFISKSMERYALNKFSGSAKNSKDKVCCS